MSEHPSQKDVETRLWSEIDKARYGMLGLVGEARQHFQPMTAFAEPELGLIWFFTRDDTDLARAVVRSGEAMFVIQAKDQAFQACVGGELTLSHDDVRIDKYWNAVVAAWYPNGRSDPRLTLLRFETRDAQVWLSERGPIKFAWEIARANATHRTPDVGESRSLNLG